MPDNPFADLPPQPKGPPKALIRLHLSPDGKHLVREYVRLSAIPTPRQWLDDRDDRPRPY
jgi:hypothetical protein